MLSNCNFSEVEKRRDNKGHCYDLLKTIACGSEKKNTKYKKSEAVASLFFGYRGRSIMDVS